MKILGFSHIDLATTNMVATRDFYEGILGFPMVRCDLIEIEGGGFSQHVFFDCGNGQMIAFGSAEHAPGRWPQNLDTGLTHGLGLPRGVYHFAFEAGSYENLLALRDELQRKGVEVRGVEDHEGWIQSIYFEDPNGLQLEICWQSRELEAEDRKARVRFRIGSHGEKLPATDHAAQIETQMEALADAPN